MKEYLYDVFLSFTGADRELKNTVRDTLEVQGLSCYDSDLYCQGHFRDDFCEALDKSRVYLMLLTDNLRNDPAISKTGVLTEIRRESALACELEARNELNIVILCMSEFFRYSGGFHDYNDLIGWHFYSLTRGFSQIDGAVDENGGLTDGVRQKIVRQCSEFISRRNAGEPVLSQMKKFEIAFENIREQGVFKGREDDIKNVFDAFREGNQTVVLWGMGGIGKTVLATEIARRCHELGYLRCPQIVHIQDLTASKGLEAVVSAVSYDESVYDSLTVLPEKDRFNKKLQVLQSLPETVLLVIDNFNFVSENDISELMKKFNFRILITTRKKFTVNLKGVRSFPVECLEEKYAYSMFCENAGQNIVCDEFHNIYERVKGHTITLCIMAKMMAAHKMSADAILGEINAADADAAKIEFVHNEYTDNDTVLGHLSHLYTISDFSEGCKKILMSMSLLEDGIISVDELCRILSLKNRNEILRLTDSGWLEILEIEENGEIREYLYLHPVLSVLMANILKPTAEKTREMIQLLLRYGSDFEKNMTFKDLSIVSGKLFYACMILAGSERTLCSELWNKFIEADRMSGDTEITEKRTAKILSYLEDERQQSLVTSYRDMIILEQYPTRVDVLEKYIATLGENAYDYKWVLRALSVTFSHLAGVEEYKSFLLDAIKKAFDSAILCHDDFALILLMPYYLELGGDKNRIIDDLSRYVKQRKKEGVDNGELMALELTQYEFTLFSFNNYSEALNKSLSLVESNKLKDYGFVYRAMLLHPLKYARFNRIVNKIDDIDESDPFAWTLKLSYNVSLQLVDEGVLDIGTLVRAVINMHQLRLRHQCTLATAADCIVPIIKMFKGFPGTDVESTVKTIVDDVNMNNLTIADVSNLQVASLINMTCKNSTAILQAKQLIDVVRRLRPEGHNDIISAMESYADICTAFGENKKALSAYVDIYRMLKKNSPESSKLGGICYQMLCNPAFSEYDVSSLQSARDAAIRNQPSYSVGYCNVLCVYATRLSEKINKGIKPDGAQMTQLYEIFLNDIKRLNSFATVSQQGLLYSLYGITVKLLNNFCPEQAKKYIELIRLFRKSRKKNIRRLADIQLKMSELNISLFSDRDKVIEAAENVISACIRHNLGLSEASISLYKIIEYRFAKKDYDFFTSYIKNEKKLEYLNSYRKDISDELRSVAKKKEMNVSSDEIFTHLFLSTAKSMQDNMGIFFDSFKHMKKTESFYYDAFRNILDETANKYCSRSYD